MTASALNVLNSHESVVLFVVSCLQCALTACPPRPFLQNLKWLDLKDNPLDPVLAKVAGDCLDEKQCKQAAVRVRNLPALLLLFLVFGGDVSSSLY